MGPSWMANFDFWSSITHYHWKISVYLMMNRVSKFSKFSIGEVYGITKFCPWRVKWRLPEFEYIVPQQIWPNDHTAVKNFKISAVLKNCFYCSCLSFFWQASKITQRFITLEQNVKYCAAARVFLAVVVGSFLRRGYCCYLQTYCCQKQLRSNWLVLQRFDLCHLDLMAMVIATV